MKWIEVKMRELGVSGNPNYKITFMLDSKAMISVFTEQYGVVGMDNLLFIVQYGRSHGDPINKK